MNIFLVLIALTILAFTWLIWLRHHLQVELSKLAHAEEKLRMDLQKRRDTVPYLLESYRLTEEVSESWLNLIRERQKFHTVEQKSLELEWKFGESLNAFLTERRVKNLSYLEAKKDISELSDKIGRQKRDWTKSINVYNELRKHFPYSVASAIFGFREVHINGLD